MKAILKGIHSPDVQNLVSFDPQGPYGILVQMMIGPENLSGEESFDTLVCSQDWLDQNSNNPNLITGHKTVMNRFDYVILIRNIENFCRSLEEDTWRELAHKLGQLGMWEFANYRG